MLQALEGRKTYLVVLAMLAYAALGLLLGKLPSDDAVRLILEALALAGLRNAIK